MRSTTLLMALLPLAVGSWAVGCGAQSASAPPGADAGGSSGGSSGGSGGSSGGTGNDGGPQSGTFTSYSPQGCAYSYAPPGVVSAGFTALAYDDDTTAVSATNGVPQRVRLGLGGGITKGQAGYADPTTTAALSWETTEYDHAAKLKIGTSATSMTTTRAGFVWTTPGSLGAPAVNMHEVHICGLMPGTTYYYQVGGGPTGSQVWSATQSFTTVPAPSTGSITIGVFGDARDNVNVWQLVHERMKQAGVAAMLVPGDVILEGADESEYQQWLGAIWKDPNNANGFLTLGEQMILPINGNHENDQPDSFANWAIPGVAGDQYAKTYDSFEIGPVHFIMIDDEHISNIGGGETDPEGSAQLTWIAADLKAANADRTAHPFIIALSHRGMFSTSNHAADTDVINTRAQLAPLYDTYKVDLAVNGHDHEYERSKPLNAGNPPTGAPTVVTAATGTQYVINAGAGADPYAINSDPQPYSSGVQVTFCGGGTACSTSPYVGIYSIMTLTPTAVSMKVYGLTLSATSYMDDPVVDTLMLTPKP
jgi:acid phosphatase type 7